MDSNGEVFEQVLVLVAGGSFDTCKNIYWLYIENLTIFNHSSNAHWA